MSNELRNFLAIPYDELEELNLNAKEQRQTRVAPPKIQEERLEYLGGEKRIKAVTVLFSDLEGRLHMLDYDKKFLLKSYDNLTFDGSSIRGFTAQRESDLRLGIDWGAVRGADLLKSTARQLLLYRAFGWTPPAFYHCELVLDDSGVRLAKRHDTLSIRHLRESGCTAEQVLR